MKYLKLTIICTSILLLNFSCSDKKQVVRPIKIKVISYETGLPIKGIYVFYNLEEKILSNKIENIFPLGGPRHDYNDYSKLKTTDNNGEVSFSNYIKKKSFMAILMGSSNEYHEYIHINIDTIDTNEPAGFIEPNRLRIKNKKYFAYYISNYDHCFDDPKEWDYQADRHIDVLINGGSLNKFSESICIKLKKISPANLLGTRKEILCND